MKKIAVKDMSKTSSQEQMECYNSGWQDGYVEALIHVYIMLTSVNTENDIKMLRESILKEIKRDE